MNRSKHEQGSVLVLVLVMSLFMATLGLALMAMTGTFLVRVRADGQEARARALARGGMDVGFRNLRAVRFAEPQGELASGRVSFADGNTGTYHVVYDMDLKLIRSTGKVGDVEKTFVARFEHY